MKLSFTSFPSISDVPELFISNNRFTQNVIHTETGHLICSENQSTGFCMKETLDFIE